MRRFARYLVRLREYIAIPDVVETPMTSTETMLLTQFNTPLLSLEQVAQILDRSPDGLRLTLRGDNEMARRLCPARRKIGRRVLFSVAELARFIDESQG